MINARRKARALAHAERASVVVRDVGRRTQRRSADELADEGSAGLVVGVENRIAECARRARERKRPRPLPGRDGSVGHRVVEGYTQSGRAEAAVGHDSPAVWHTIEGLFALPVDAD